MGQIAPGRKGESHNGGNEDYNPKLIKQLYNLILNKPLLVLFLFSFLFLNVKQLKTTIKEIQGCDSKRIPPIGRFNKERIMSKNKLTNKTGLKKPGCQLSRRTLLLTQPPTQT